MGVRHGHEVKNLGDGLMVAFASAVDALACAVAMQQALYGHNQQNVEHQLQVRVGLHVGEPAHEEADYFGTTVDIASRLCDSGDGGQIVASALVRGLVGTRGSHTFRDLGALSLKGIAEPVSACEVLWEPPVDQPTAAQPAVGEPAGPPPLPPLVGGGERAAFVGRDGERAQLRRYWERARLGERQFVLLAGEPGIGKTRLAAEFAVAAHAEGATVLFGRSDEDAILPYQPFAEALQYYLAAWPPEELRARLGAAAARLARIVPELAERLPDMPEVALPDSESERHRLFEAVASLLVEASRASPIVLVLDDLQWADRPTLLLLKHILRAPEQSPLLILGTYRGGELGRRHPLSETLADLRRDRAFERITLQGLREGDVGAMISAWGGEDAPPDFIQAIYQPTEGNPFFVEELLRDLSETGAISEQDGRLTNDLAAAQLPIPESVKEVISRRLARLSEECNSVLTVASVIGRGFGLDALARASDLSNDRLLEALEEAVDACVVRETPNVVGSYSFSHALIHETLYDELSTTRRVRLHGQTLQYADSNGVKLAYEVLGASGPYLIVVGLSNCPAVRSRNWDTTQHWDRMVRHCRVILYDRRGVGFSAAPERGYSLLAGIADLRAVLDAAGVERAVVWGATDGGPLAIAFAAHHPERVAGLILAGTSAKYTSSEDFALGIDAVRMESFLRHAAVDQGRAVSQFTRLMRPERSGAEAIGEVMERVPRRVWSKILGSLGAADARSLLAQVQAPTLIVHDPDNTYIPVEAAHYLHEHLPGSELEITSDYRALPLADSLYRRLETFIGEATTRSPP